MFGRKMGVEKWRMTEGEGEPSSAVSSVFSVSHFLFILTVS